MKKGWFVRTVLVSLSVAGMSLSQVAYAAGPAAKSVIKDVALTEGGMLVGQVVNPQNGTSMASVPVTVRSQDQVVATTTTDTTGRFAVRKLRAGVHQIIAGEGQGVYRFWAPGTAPPAAEVNAVVYVEPASQAGPNDPVTYVQYGEEKSGLKMFLTNPLVIGGVIATAIAVPVALNNSHSSSP